MARLIFLGGMGRSGTNLLRNMLDSHSHIASGPEFNHLQDLIEVHRILSGAVENGRITSYVDQFKLNSLTKQFISGLLCDYGEDRGKSWVVEKTPSNIWIFPDLADLFPEARFIQIVRDGRDVCCSHREVGKRHVANGYQLHPKQHSSLLSVFHCASLWSQTIQLGKQLCSPQSPLQIQRRIMTVKYEDLVTDPETVMRQVCDFIGVSYEDEMVHPENTHHDTFIDGVWVQQHETRSPISTSSVGRWRTIMSLEERVLFTVNGLAGLVAAGYATPPTWCFEGLSVDAQSAKEIIKQAQNKIPHLSSFTDEQFASPERLSLQVESIHEQSREKMQSPSLDGERPSFSTIR